MGISEIDLYEACRPRSIFKNADFLWRDFDGYADALWHHDGRVSKFPMYAARFYSLMQPNITSSSMTKVDEAEFLLACSISPLIFGWFCFRMKFFVWMRFTPRGHFKFEVNTDFAFTIAPPQYSGSAHTAAACLWCLPPSSPHCFTSSRCARRQCALSLSGLPLLPLASRAAIILLSVLSSLRFSAYSSLHRN